MATRSYRVMNEVDLLDKYSKKHGISDRELARRLNVYPCYLYRWKKTRKMSKAYRVIVSEFLKVNK